jgi:hypothetical protein
VVAGLARLSVENGRKQVIFLSVVTAKSVLRYQLSHSRPPPWALSAGIALGIFTEGAATSRLQGNGSVNHEA